MTSVRYSCKDEKGMPFMNLKIVNAKSLKMKFKKTSKIWHMYSLRFNHSRIEI